MIDNLIYASSWCVPMLVKACIIIHMEILNYTNLHKEQAGTKISDQFLSALKHVLMTKSVLLDLGFDQLRNHSYVSPEENLYIGVKMDILVPED